MSCPSPSSPAATQTVNYHQIRLKEYLLLYIIILIAGDIHIWNVDSGVLYHAISEHSDNITDIVLYKNKLISASISNLVLLHDTASWENVGVFEMEHVSGCLVVDHTTLYVGVWKHGIFAIDLEAMAEIGYVDESDDDVLALYLAKDTGFTGMIEVRTCLREGPLN